ncbi:VCBS repeat-containing protein [Flavimarina sp. Hel_I_48]|uniref:VCBS repeat-containing protein n=1 Tax=Flavimarina sp. Hel_I_48 TaxID=1392488 RepID=UPI0004DF854F|nr:VCBS repeat-containing protein [Flavimarina sp. Hel_I_48]
MNKCLLLWISVAMLLSCTKEQKENPALFFQKISADSSGVDFANILTETRDQNILDYLYYYNGGGVSIGDINNDGLPDIYFTGNQIKNKLYLNKGDLKFEDITAKAGVAGTANWNTGTAMADVNGDGLLDIYVCAVVGINGFMGYNQLFINNGDLTFKERAKEYGLDFENYSSQAAFFDVDNDGDLDMYLLNHAIHTANSFGMANIREKRVSESGDKLLINESGKFIDRSEEAGIYGGANSYGLGIATSDFNNDGFTDIYVSNDFHEDDYYYLNNDDGTFTECLKTNFGHISRFSMGSDAADINNDGFIDLITLDMLPEEESILKTSAKDDNVDTDRMRIERLGYHPQYSRNMLQINQNGKYFAETGLLSGVAASDWSWGALFADYDQDGYQDLFISNGIPRRPNDLDYIKYSSTDQVRQKLETTNLIDERAINKMPSGKVTNYIYSGAPDALFTNQSKNWIANDSLPATGSAYADLDNDGDLDLVTNNINAPASIYENKGATGSFLKLKFKDTIRNTFAIGTKAIAFSNGKLQYRQLYTTKSWQSSSEPTIHFGFKEGQKLDSLLIVWPDQKAEILYDIALDQTLTLNPSAVRFPIDLKNYFGNVNTQIFFKVADNLGIDYAPVENEYSDFGTQKLLLHKLSDQGPGVSVGDINKDGLDDIIFGSVRFQEAKVFLQDQNGFKEKKQPAFALNKNKEETSAVLGDFDNNGTIDLYFATGDGESIRSVNLEDSYYSGDDEGNFTLLKNEAPLRQNNSVICKSDIDGDGDLDIFLGANGENLKYGSLPASSLLINTDGKFLDSNQEVFKKLGMITDAVFEDFDQDGDKDLIVVGEWMRPTFIRNDNGRFTDVTDELLEEKLNGLWQTVLPFDLDEDGDMDYLLGNWGLNSKLHASTKFPLVLYHADFDNNGLQESIIAQEKNGNYYLEHDLDLLSSQLSIIRKKFNTYKDFAGKTAVEVMGKKALETAEKLEIHTLASGYLENTNGAFKFRTFSNALQIAPIKAMLNFDFDNDGREEVLLGGNYFGLTPYYGKFDAMGGVLLKSGQQDINTAGLGLNFFQKSVRHLSIVEVDKVYHLLVTYNNVKAELYKIGER